MKFRNQETGEVFSTITGAWTAFMCPGPCGDCNLQRGSTCEKEWIEAHPNEAARLMGYEVVEDDTEYYLPSNLTEFCTKTGEKWWGRTVNYVEEANMDKPLKDWTLWEVKAYCTGRDCYKDCELVQGPGKCKILDVTPSEWDLDEKPRFTQQEVEDAKTIKRMFDCAGDVIVERHRDHKLRLIKNGGVLGVFLNMSLFSSIQTGQSYTLDEIIGGAE